MECRSSGLSDHQWCKEHDIEPSTFYNWVSRLRQRGCTDIPEPTKQDHFIQTQRQEVVKLEMCPETPISTLENPVTIKVSIGPATVHIPNGVDPLLLTQVFKCLGGAVC